MARKNKTEKRRAARERKRLQNHEQDIDLQKEIDELELPISDDEIPSDEPEEIVRKSYEEPYEYPSPTSWDEVEALKVARKKAEEVSEMSWTVRDLVGNIVRSNMTPDEKAKAISEVGNGFSARIKSVGDKKMEKEIHDMDLLVVKALIGRDKRHTTLSERVSDFLSKATMTASFQDNLPDDQFAIVLKDVDEKVRKYPLHDKAHVRKALADVAELLEKGGEGSEDARVALPQICKAAKEMGVGQEANSIIIEKDLSGQWRALMYPTNNFKDTDNEILTESSHLEYVDWVNKNMDLAPVFVSWHIPELVRKNAVDFVAYESGYLLMSAPLEEHEAAELLRAQEKYTLGMSHGTFPLERDPANPKIITKYRMVEVSDLPLKRAANPFTDFSVISKENKMNDKEKLEYLSTLLGKDKAIEFFDRAGLKQKALREIGVEEKEAKPAPEPAASAPATSPESNNPDMEVLFKAIEERLDIPGLQEFVTEAKVAIEKIPLLEAVLKQKQEATDDILAEKIAPKIEKQLAWSRPSQDPKNVADPAVEGDETLIKSKPKHWLEEVANIPQEA